MDGLKPSFKGHIFNPFLKFRLNRRIAFIFAIGLGLMPWILFGFDSCLGQPITLLYRMPEFLTGQISYETWIKETWVNYYGKELHYSAFLIYGLMYWWLSRYFDKNFNIVNSKNVAYSFSLTFLSIGLFEFFWMGSYAHFQKQSWVLMLRMPQLRIILQNILFVTVGVLGTLYMWVDSFVLNKRNEIVKRLYRFRVDKIAVFLIVLSIATAVLWWYYPGYVERFSVTLETGDTWTNSVNFPQTLYTINMNPNDNLNAGVWFFVENNLVHGLNTLVKALWAITICYIGLVRKVK